MIPFLTDCLQAVGLVAPSDIPYCGEVEPPEEPPLAQEMCSTYGVPSMMSRVRVVGLGNVMVYCLNFWVGKLSFLYFLTIMLEIQFKI